MPRNLLQDMVRTKRSKPPAPVERVRIEEATIEPRVVYSRPRRRSSSKNTLWLVAIVSVVFCLFSVSYLFSSVKINIDPKIKTVALNTNLSATQNASGETLPFNLIVISGEETETISATETRDVLEKASGTVIIYNNFGYATQKLTADTRLSGSNGKIYKIKTAVSVPGIVGTKPGSVEVGIYAAEAGEEYNSVPIDFNVTGFLGTPKYSKFYARSKGDISGGFKGKSPAVSDVDKASALARVKVSLQEKLLQKATDQIPEGFILFKDAAFLNIDQNSADFNSHEVGTVPVTLKGALYGILFNEEKLTKKIIDGNVKNYDNSAAFISNIKDLGFSMISPGSMYALGSEQDISFNLKGTVNIVWKLDEAKFITDLLGKSKTDFNAVLATYPNVDSADLTISPFWKMSLPDKSKDIHVFVNYPK